MNHARRSADRTTKLTSEALPTDSRTMWAVFKEFLHFLRQEKKWWLVPFVVILLLLGMFLVFAPTSPLAPFIYSLF